MLCFYDSRYKYNVQKTYSKCKSTKLCADGNANQRSCVLMDIAIFLAKRRGQIYSRNLGVIEMVAGAEEAAVMM